MKECHTCNTFKSLDLFYTQSDRKSGSSMCKECFNKYCVDRWVQRKLKAIQYKGGCCTKCGYNKYYGALEFHHVDPLTKDVNWTKLRLKSWIKITEELDKCNLLCANCHREEHALSS